MLKKYLMLLICLTCVVLLFGCNDANKAEPTNKPEPTATVSEATPTAEPTEAPTPSPTKEPAATMNREKRHMLGRLMILKV